METPMNSKKKMESILNELPKDKYSKAETKNGILMLLGDSINIIPNIKTKFDACITDPPYNISGYDHKKKIGWLQSNNHWKDVKGFNKVDEDWDKFSNGNYEKFTEDWISNICRIVKENGNILIFSTYHNLPKITKILEKLDKRIMTFIVWYKRNAFPNITCRGLCESTEYIIWDVNNSQKDAKNWTFNYASLKELNDGKQMRNVWDFPMTPPSEKKHGKHPTQKPEEIIKRLVLGFTNESDKIIDPFMGSGTILHIANKFKRKCMGIDNQEEYFNITFRRISNG